MQIKVELLQGYGCIDPAGWKSKTNFEYLLNLFLGYNGIGKIVERAKMICCS